jgi:hypothetical protein
MKNIYGRALRHLNNKNIDEKLELVEAIPTNNTTGIFMDVPGEFVTVPGDVPREADLGTDGDGAEGYTGGDTSGLFLSDGTILIEEPPGDRSYVLGPMISMWYSWANYTQIGYVRQSDRRMVNLGRITGELESWDGESGFTSYGQLTIEQAVWYKNQSRSDYRAFYPGPPSNPADQYGRYIGSMVDTTKPATITRKDPDTTKSFDPSDNFAAQVARGEVDIPEIPRGTAEYDLASELAMLGLAYAAVKSLMGLVTAGGLGAVVSRLKYVSKLRTGRGALNPFGQRAVRSGAAGRQRVDVFSGRPYQGKRGFGKTTYGTTDPKTAATYSNPGPLKGTPGTGSRVNPRGTVDRGTLPQRYIDKYGSRSVLGQKQVKLGKKAAKRTFGESLDKLQINDRANEFIETLFAQESDPYEKIDQLIKSLEKYSKSKKSVKESKEVLSEDRKRIIRDLRKPVQVEEIGPPTKFKFKPKQRENKSVGVDMMKIPDTPKQYKPPMNIWGKGDYNANVRSSQEKKNEVLELVGASEHHWTYMTDERKRKHQEKVNEMQSAEYDRELEMLYEKYRKEEKKINKLKTAVRKKA